MARKKAPQTPAGAVPVWFMTYSDTITLLMTFFILLLTFASNEPEHFQQMKTAVFGSKGSAGLAGENKEALDQDVYVVRYRPPSSRLTSRGSETPMEQGPILESLSKGLKSLDDEEVLANARQLEFDAPITLLLNPDGSPSSYALQRLRMIAIQMRSNPVTLRLSVPAQLHLRFAVQCALILTSDPRIAPSRVAVSMQDLPDLPEGQMRFSILQNSH